MSLNVPSNDVPSFSSSQRPYEDGYWQASKRSAAAANGHAPGNIGSKINEFFKEGQELPMYKDKPHYPASRRKGWLQRKRTYGVMLLVVVAVLWWTGTGRGLSEPSDTGGKFNKEYGLGGSTWFGGSSSKDKGVDWPARRDKVREAFITSWDGYEKYAWGMDEYHPVSKKGQNMVDGGMGWIIVDALDTAIMMNLTSKVKHARQWISSSLNYEINHEVNTFETTIRMLGGLLSAHYLSTSYPQLAPLKEDDVNQPGEDLYIEKATDLADRLLGAFDSKSGIPYASVNLNMSQGIPSHGDGGASSTAEAATLQLEMKYMAKLTGEDHFWHTAEKVLEIIDSQHREDGLLPIYIYATTGQFRGDNIRLGSRGDSYYEYLIKQYLQTGSAETLYLDMWNEALEGIKKHLLTYTEHSAFTILGERPSGLNQKISPKMDHLVCFMPGTIALAVTGGQTVSEAKARLGSAWTAKQDEDLYLAKELMKTCWGMYKATKTGLAPEITYFKIDDPPRKWTGLAGPKSDDLDSGADAEWLQDYTIHSNDVHNLQRPETVESLFYMYRITGDVMYRNWGWEMFESFTTHSAVKYQYDEHHEKDKVYSYTSLENANKIPPSHRDNMESFWLAETLKYFWLLFGEEEEWTRLDKTVINTEAHFFPRFEMGKVFQTGWEREKVPEKVEEAHLYKASSEDVGSVKEAEPMGEVPTWEDVGREEARQHEHKEETVPDASTEKAAVETKDDGKG